MASTTRREAKIGKGSNTTSTSSTSSADPQAAALYRDILTRAQGVASTPYQAYTGELTAGNNAQQSLGVSGINANAGYANPYIQQAAGQATQYSGPISGSDISRYLNPYTQNVVDATTSQLQHDFAQQNAQLQGNQIAQGALGGNATGVAKAILAGQQGRQLASTTSGLYQQGYQQAVDAAQRQQQTGLAGANAIANYGISGQNAALQGASAQFGVGTQQQQTEQARLDALYKQYVQQQAFPYQQTQWLAGLGTGVGSNLGGTSSGQTTAPAPNQAAQWLGAGISAAGLFLNRGGAVHGDAFDVPHMASGGVSGTPWGDGVGWIPQMNIHGGSGAPQGHAPSAPSSGSNFDASKMAGSISGIAGGDWKHDWSGGLGALQSGAGLSGDSWGGGSFWGGDSYGGSAASPLAGLDASDYAFARGGGVAGYADGGSPTFDERYGDDMRELGHDLVRRDVGNRLIPSDVINPDDPIRLDSSATDQWRKDTPTRGVAGPPVAAQDDDPEELPPAATPTQGGAQPRGGVAPPPPMYQPSPAAPRQSPFGLGLISPNAKTGLLAAGLGMLASRSPFLGNAVGEGGLAGVAAYGRAEEHDRKVAAEADKLAREASSTAYERWMGERKQGETERHNKASESAADRPAKLPALYAKDKDGNIILAPGAEEATKKLSAARKGGEDGQALSQEAITMLASRVRAGDERALVGLGRGAQGRKDLVAVQEEVARQANAGEPVHPAARNILMNAAQQQGLKAAERTQAQIMAKLSVYGRTAFNATDIALEASKAVPRTNYPKANVAINAFKANTGDPKIRALGQALQTLSNEYARAIGGGHGTVHMQEQAEKRLNEADSHEQLEAIVNMMRREIVAEERAMPAAREHIRDIYNPPPGGAGGKSIAGEHGMTPPSGPVSGASLPPGTFVPPPGAIPRVYNGKTYYYHPDTKQPYPGQ